jgi:hypothetical protein
MRYELSVYEWSIIRPMLPMLTLVVIPAIYAVVKGFALRKMSPTEGEPHAHQARGVDVISIS